MTAVALAAFAAVRLSTQNISSYTRSGSDDIVLARTLNIRTFTPQTLKETSTLRLIDWFMARLESGANKFLRFLLGKRFPTKCDKCHGSIEDGFDITDCVFDDTAGSFKYTFYCLKCAKGKD